MIREARKIIKANPLESLTYHKNKLEEYNIFFTDAKINHLIYDIRNEIYPADEEILKNINHITITYDDKLPNSKNLPFCPVYNKFINHCKKNRLESFIIITSFFLLKFLMNISHLFIDATFKIAPKNYYQILNIIGYDETKNFNMPVFHIIMSNKSFESYNKIFQEILNLLDEYKIKINFKNIIINCDFEKSLINAIRNNFKEIKIYGCYFHYVKALWKKARKLGLTKSKLLSNTKLLIFSIKIYPFILNKKKQDFVKEIYDYFLSTKKDYKTFIKYFQTNWENSQFLDFEVLSDGTINNRTDNIVEAFHHKINNAIGYIHPKLSLIIDKLKLFSILYYHKYINKLFTKDIDKLNNTNIFNDIYNFLSRFLNNIKKNIDFKLLLQDEGETKKI